MSAATAVTAQDLELEHAELLPARETLCCCGRNQSYNVQVSVLSGSNVASGNNVALVNFGGQSASTSAAGNSISG